LAINFKELLIFLKPGACFAGMDVGHNRIGENEEMMRRVRCGDPGSGVSGA
jgi:hypothetical protein